MSAIVAKHVTECSIFSVVLTIILIGIWASTEVTDLLKLPIVTALLHEVIWAYKVWCKPPKDNTLENCWPLDTWLYASCPTRSILSHWLRETLLLSLRECLLWGEVSRWDMTLCPSLHHMPDSQLRMWAEDTCSYHQPCFRALSTLKRATVDITGSLGHGCRNGTVSNSCTGSRTEVDAGR